MTDRELMQQALDALDAEAALNVGRIKDALRKRLAQPEQWEQSPLDRMAENARELGLDYEPVNTIANSEAIPEQISEPEQKPVNFTSLLNEAEEIVRAKPVWKRFIDGTPLSNDIAVWMTVFALDAARRTTPPRREWVGLTEEEIYPLYSEPSSDAEMVEFARAIEAKLKEKNT